MKMNLKLTFLLLVAAPWLATAQTNPVAPSISLPTPAAQAATSLVASSSASLPAIQPPVEDIRDIRGPVEIPSSFRWLYGLLGALAAGGIGRYFWKAFRRRRVALLVRRAYEIAFDELDDARAWMEPEKARQFSIAVSGSLRKYIEGRFQIGATHQTTLEFLRQLAHDKPEVLHHHAGALEEFHKHCDLAKFAQSRLSVEQMQGMLKSAWDFVDQTRPPDDERTSRRAAKKQTSVVGNLAVHGGAS